MTKQVLSKNHLFLTTENDIRSICSHLLNPLGITYFYYLRYYNDGSCYFLSTHGDAINYAFEICIPIAAPIAEKLVKKKFSYFVLPIGKYNKWLHHVKINFKLDYLIDLVDRYDNYIDLFCFGSTPDNSEIINFYLNNFDFLENFKIYFKDKASYLIKNCETNKIILPDIMKPPYQGLHESESDVTASAVNKKFFLKSNNGNIKLTSRQYDCLSQLAAGCTAKEASRNLGISHRTFENYLANVKSILDCHKKSQLIDLFLKNFNT